MKKPNFFIVGAPRCGTTALHTYLKDHPQIFLSTPKEPIYFSTGALRGDERALEEYLRLFAGAPAAARAIGESSTTYIFVDGALQALHQFAPDARLTVMVRNPVDQLKSLHAHNYFTGTEDVIDIRQAWELQAVRQRGEQISKRSRDNHCALAAFLQYDDACSHGRNIVRAQQIFPAEQLQVIVFDDLRAHAPDVYAETLKHIGVPHDGRTDFSKVNETRYIAPNHGVAKAIASFSSKPIKKLAQVLGLRHKNLKRSLTSRFAGEAPAIPVPEEFLAEMRQHFKPDVELLSSVLGRDLVKEWGYA
jgi:hypothetical protein